MGVIQSTILGTPRATDRFDALKDRQFQEVQDLIDAILQLPSIRGEGFFDRATQNPEIFILFLVRQLRHLGMDVEAVDCPELNNYEASDNIEQDFYYFRQSLTVYLLSHGVNDPQYLPLVVIPNGSDDGLEQATNIQQLFDNIDPRGDIRGPNLLSQIPGLAHRTADNMAAPDLVLLLRQAVPNAEVMRQYGLIRPFPQDALLFMKAFVRAAERATPGIFARFSQDGDSSRAFISAMLDLYGYGDLLSSWNLTEFIPADVYEAVRGEIVQILPNLGPLYTQALRETFAGHSLLRMPPPCQSRCEPSNRILTNNCKTR